MFAFNNPNIASAVSEDAPKSPSIRVKTPPTVEMVEPGSGDEAAGSASAAEDSDQNKDNSEATSGEQQDENQNQEKPEAASADATPIETDTDEKPEAGKTEDEGENKSADQSRDENQNKPATDEEQENNSSTVPSTSNENETDAAPASEEPYENPLLADVGDTVTVIFSIKRKYQNVCFSSCIQTAGWFSESWRLGMRTRATKQSQAFTEKATWDT